MTPQDRIAGELDLLRRSFSLPLRADLLSLNSSGTYPEWFGTLTQSVRRCQAGLRDERWWAAVGGRRAEAVRLVSGETRSVAAVAAALGVSWDTVMGAVRNDAAWVLAVQDQPRVSFGLDEIQRNPIEIALPPYVTVFVDLDRHRLIDVVEGRHAAAVTRVAIPRRTRSVGPQVASVALDPHAGYRSAVTDPTVGSTTPSWLRSDFHVVKPANAAIDDVRRRLQ